MVLGVRGIDAAAEQLHGMAWVIMLGLPILVAAAVFRVPEGRAEGFDHPRLVC